MRKDFTLLKEKTLLHIFKENATSSKKILILEVLVFFSNTLYNSTIEFLKLFYQSSLESKIENSKGEKFMKSITLDYFFQYTLAWDHPSINIVDQLQASYNTQDWTHK
jgi:hypothetical protein